MGEQQTITAGQDWTTEINGQLVLLPQNEQEVRKRKSYQGDQHVWMKGTKYEYRSGGDNNRSNVSDGDMGGQGVLRNDNENNLIPKFDLQKDVLDKLDKNVSQVQENLIEGYPPVSTDRYVQQGTIVGTDAFHPYKGVVKYINKEVAKSRKLEIQPQLEEIIAQAATATGLNIQIYSGGQTAKKDMSRRREIGSGRTGSPRHDYGYAVDIWFFKGTAKGPFKGRQLNVNKQQDVPLLEAFARACLVGGATSIGMGPVYMDGVGMHVDIAYFGVSPVKYHGPWGDNEEQAGSAPFLIKLRKEGLFKYYPYG